MVKSAKSALALAAFVLLAIGAIGAITASPAQAAICGSPQVSTLFAGQTMNAGSITVSNDDLYIYVQYSTVYPWVINDAHLAVSGTLAGIPQTKRGNPIPGHFSYSTIFDPEVADTTFAVPMGSFLPGQVIYIGAHAVVQAPAGQGGTQTGWGFGPGFPGANWATYIQYVVRSCAPVPE